MQILVPLIALFFMDCRLYSISAGVQAITGKAAQLVNGREPYKPEAQSVGALISQYLHVLHELHEEQQRDALSLAAFQQFKKTPATCH